MGWLLAGRAVRSLSQAFLVIVLPLYVAAAGYSTKELGALLSIASVGSIGTVAAVGFLSDRFGRRAVMIGLAALSAVGCVTYALSARFWVLATASALTSLGRGGGAGSGGARGPFYPAEQALVAESVPPERRNGAFGALSFITVLSSAAGSAVVGVTGILHLWLGLSWIATYRWLFWLAAGLALLLGLLCLPLREQKQRRSRATRLSRGSKRLIGRLWLTNGLTGLAWGIMGPFLTYWFYRRFGVGAVTLGGLYTLINLATTLPYLGAAWLARRLGAVRTITFSRLFSTVFLFAMAVAPTFLWAAAFYVLRMLFSSLGIPIRQSYVVGVADEENRSSVAALSSLPSQVTASVSPSLGAYLMEEVSMAAPYYMASAVLLLNAWAYFAFFHKEPPPEERRAPGNTYPLGKALGPQAPPKGTETR